MAIKHLHPVHPIILVILIQTNNNYQTPHHRYQNNILSSFNPGNPDSDKIITNYVRVAFPKEILRITNYPHS